VWIKRGLIYFPDNRMNWAVDSALTPTPFLLNENIIRVFAGFRDINGVSRIGFVDVDSKNPSKVIRVSETPVVDIGQPGTFDDNGLILGDVIRQDDKVFMYYVGFQLVEKVKFQAFTGLALSKDGGTTFEKYSFTPVMDRSDEGLHFRAIHSVMIEDGVWKVWYGVGSEWAEIKGRKFPQYKTHYIESVDGINFDKLGTICIDFVGDEYRIGRPRVHKVGGKYIMYYTVGTLRATYLPGYAESIDGKEWIRNDSKVGIGTSESGWDSRSLSYTAPLRCGNKEYLFYNGNDMGKNGFGYAERLIQGFEND